jgi:hypothetical protein
LLHLPAGSLHRIGWTDAAVREDTPNPANRSDRLLLRKCLIRSTEAWLDDRPPGPPEPNTAGPTEFNLAVAVHDGRSLGSQRIDHDPDRYRVVLGIEAIQVQTALLGCDDDQIGGDVVTVRDRNDVGRSQKATMPVTESSAGRVTDGCAPASAGSARVFVDVSVIAR